MRPLESLTSALVEKVDQEAGEQQAQALLKMRRVERLLSVVVPLTAVFTLLIAATLGVVLKHQSDQQRAAGELRLN